MFYFPKLGSKKIIIAPLSWGLGHATRCIPIIREILNHNHKVIITAGEAGIALLEKEFPSLEYVLSKGYNFKYPENGNMKLAMAISAPSILKGIFNEQKEAELLSKKTKAAAIISDNRYGYYSNFIPSVFITHQIFIKSSLFQSLLHKLTFSFINKFMECWVPDFSDPDANLSGDLSHLKKYPGKFKFVGPLSRFRFSEDATQKTNDFLAIISGPEPQRSIFESLILDQLINSGLKGTVITGQPDVSEKTRTNGNINIYSHLNQDDFENEARKSNVIISRSGYSTIMDLYFLQLPAIFIPTPGQTEQEYLASYHSIKGHSLTLDQDNFHILPALKKARQITGFQQFKSRKNAWEDTAIGNFLLKI